MNCLYDILPGLCARGGRPSSCYQEPVYPKAVRPLPLSVLNMLLPFDRWSCLRVRLSSVGCADISEKEKNQASRLWGPEGREVLRFWFDVSFIHILPPSCSLLNGFSSDLLRYPYTPEIQPPLFDCYAFGLPSQLDPGYLLVVVVFDRADGKRELVS
jgi:hypothetical protein